MQGPTLATRFHICSAPCFLLHHPVHLPGYTFQTAFSRNQFTVSSSFFSTSIFKTFCCLSINILQFCAPSSSIHLPSLVSKLTLQNFHIFRFGVCLVIELLLPSTKSLQTFDPMTCASHTPLSMGLLNRILGGLPFYLPGDLPDSWVEPLQRILFPEPQKQVTCRSIKSKQYRRAHRGKSLSQSTPHALPQPLPSPGVTTITSFL